MDFDKVKALIPTYPDFPKKGINFFDIHPIMQNPEALSFLVEQLYERYKGESIFIFFLPTFQLY
jgi:adenine phosphoribosyltransferase